MAQYFTDSAVAPGGAGTAADPFASPAEWPSAWLQTSGNEYYLKRDRTYTWQTQVLTENNSASLIVFEAYWNADGTDDTSKPEPVITTSRVSTAADWTYDGNGTGANIWRKTGSGEFYGFLGDGGGNGVWGQERDVDAPFNNWLNASIPLTLVGDWDFYTSGSGIAGQKVMTSGTAVANNPGNQWSGGIRLGYLTGAREDRYPLRIRRPMGGYRMRNILFKYNYGGWIIDFGIASGGSTLVPGIDIQDCESRFSYYGWATMGGSSSSLTNTGVVGATGMIVRNIRCHSIGESGYIHRNSSWVSFQGGSVWSRHVYSYCCQSNANGAFYIQYIRNLSGDPANDLLLDECTVSNTAYGTGCWGLDGMDYYLEWLCGGVKVYRCVSWGSKKGANSNPLGDGGENTFQLCTFIGQGTTSLSGIVLSGAIANPPAVRRTNILDCMFRDYPNAVYLSHGWENETAMNIDGLWSRGTLSNGSTTGSCIITQNAFIGSLSAPAKDCHIYRHTGTGCTPWWSIISSDQVGGGGSVGAGDRPASGGWFQGGTVDTSNNDAVTLYPWGGATPSDIDVNYALLLGSDYYQLLDPTYPDDSTVGTFLNRPQRRRR